MPIVYEWRGEVTSEELNQTPRRGLRDPGVHDEEWDWRAQVAAHSLGWVVARDDTGALVGFVNVVWDGGVHAWLQDTMVAAAWPGRASARRSSKPRPERARPPAASGSTSTSTTTSAASTSTPAASPRPPPACWRCSGRAGRAGSLLVMDASADASEGGLHLRLSDDEALVLFEWLQRNEEVDQDLASAGVDDPAERQVLWSLSGCLMRALAEPFRADYLDLLEAARSRLRPPSTAP